LLESAISEAPVRGLDEEGPIWLEALPARTYKTPVYGEVPITIEKLDRMIRNFNENVRGQEIAIDYEHGFDSAKGKKAAGWYKEFAIRPSSDDPETPALFTRVEFTEEAKKEVKDKQWKYFSLDWLDEWEDNNGAKHQDVVVGGGLTNRPIAKKTMPINFSESMWDELDEEDKKRFSVMAGLRVIGEQNGNILNQEQVVLHSQEQTKMVRMIHHSKEVGEDQHHQIKMFQAVTVKAGKEVLKWVWNLRLLRSQLVSFSRFLTLIRTLRTLSPMKL